MAGRYTEQVAYLKNVSSGGTNHFTQAVLADFVGSSSFDNQVRKTHRMMTERIARVSDAVSKYFPEECSVSTPQGGFVLWVQMPAEVDAQALHREAIGRGIAFMPGQLFSASAKFGNYIRLNCGNAWSEQIDSAIRITGELVHGQLEGPVAEKMSERPRVVAFARR